MSEQQPYEPDINVIAEMMVHQGKAASIQEALAWLQAGKPVTLMFRISPKAWKIQGVYGTIDETR